MDPRPAPDVLQAEIMALLGQRTLTLATVSAAGEPEASVAPFVGSPAEGFYVYLSGLAAHAGNLLHTPRAGVLLVEPEAEATQVFARRRLSYRCQAEPVARDDPRWQPVMERFSAGFGPVVAVLRGLADFQLFRLRPRDGRYVRGFGQAYRLEGPAFDRLLPLQPPNRP